MKVTTGRDVPSRDWHACGVGVKQASGGKTLMKITTGRDVPSRDWHACGVGVKQASGGKKAVANPENARANQLRREAITKTDE